MWLAKSACTRRRGQRGILPRTENVTGSAIKILSGPNGVGEGGLSLLDCENLVDVCTYGILYSVGRLLDRATDRAAYNKPKVQKINEITELCTV